MEQFAPSPTPGERALRNQARDWQILGALSGPGGEVEGTLIGSARVDRLAVGDDDALEWQLQQGVQRRQRALVVARRRPDTQLAAGRGQRVGEYESALLGQPQGRLVAAASVVECEEPSRKRAAGLDKL